ncbi:hypothetical protein ADK66_03785 [Micromonospora sp. NRRL B-16802]|nr:hypothetical protein ADK66_03785 [Micromonospora sp. NRRL B-16802]
MYAEPRTRPDVQPHPADPYAERDRPARPDDWDRREDEQNETDRYDGLPLAADGPLRHENGDRPARYENGDGPVRHENGDGPVRHDDDAGFPQSSSRRSGPTSGRTR